MPGQGADFTMPPGFKLFQLEGMAGMNTKAQRPAIADQELYWSENFQLIGPANARTLWGPKAEIYTAGVGLTIKYQFYYNVGTTAYGAAFLDDGSAEQFRLSDGNVTTIAAAGTFYSTGHVPQCVQWANKGILIVNDAGADNYWAWDGTTLFRPGDFAPSWLSGLASALTFTGDTNTSTSITNVTPDPTSTVTIGMGISDSAGDIPAGATITNDTATTFTISDAATASTASDTLTVNWRIPTGIAGTAIEIFLSRVWILNGTTRLTSVASNGCDFSTANGGVSAPNTDSTLRAKYTGLRAANGYLYVFGDSECAYITNVQTTDTPTTTYQYTVIDPQIGTPWRDSIMAFGRAILFANTNGVYALYGSSANKISDQLDGIWNDSVADFDTLNPSVGASTIFGIKTFCISIKTTSLYSGVQETLIAMYDGKKWFMGSQSPAPILIAPQELNSHLACFGSDGSTIYEMFALASSTLQKTMISKLWGGEYGFIARKQASRMYSQVQAIDGGDASVTMELDNENGALASTASFQQTLTFVNNSSVTLQFQNNSLQDLLFQSIAAISYNNVDGSGLLLGFTLTTTSKDFVVLRGAIGYFNKTLLY